MSEPAILLHSDTVQPEFTTHTEASRTEGSSQLMVEVADASSVTAHGETGSGRVAAGGVKPSSEERRTATALVGGWIP